MAYSKARRLSDSISATGEVSAFVDGSITHADLHTDMDLTGKTVLVANASTGDSDTTAANTAFVQQEIAALVASAPGTLNTLNELAAALGDDASFSTTVTNSIALKAPLASPTFTGTVEIPNLTISSAQGSDGQVLTSTGSGVAWENVASGVADGSVTSAKLDTNIAIAGTLGVTGTGTFTGLVDAAIIDGANFKVNGAQGSDGQVLTSTGSGVAWATPTDTNTTYSAGTGLSLTGTTFANTSPNIVQTTITGNAGTATTLQTARTINGVSFNGSANITVADSTKLPLAGGTMTGELNITSNTGVTGSSAPSYTNAKLEVQTSDNNVPAIAFHRGGHSATALYEYDGELYANAWIARAQTGKLISTGNIGSYALPLAGGTLTGALTVNGTFSSNGIDDNKSYSGSPVIVINSNSSVTMAEGFGSAHVSIGTTTDLGAKLNVADTNVPVAYFKMLGVAGGPSNPLTSFQSSAAYITHYLQAFYNSSGTRAGSVTIANGTATTVSFVSSSDYRLKENIDYTWDATSRLKDLKPARFSWISDDTNTLVDGFIAHEVSDIVPEAVTGEKDAVDEEGNPEYQGIDQAKLVPLLVKTIQELEARITTLENA